MKIRYRMKYRLIFMWLYLLAVYVPYCIIMFYRHDTNTISISVIGWYTGGLQYLIAYLVLTLPIGLYLLFHLNRYIAGNYKWVYITSVLFCAFMIIGGFIPLRWEEQYLHINTIHEYVSIISTIGFMFVIWITLIICACKSTLKLLYLVLLGVYPVVLIVGFFILWTSALYQLSATLSFLIILLLVNTIAMLRR